MATNPAAEWTHWRHVNKCELWQAAILTIDLDPRLFGVRQADHIVMMLEPGLFGSDVMNAIDSHIGIAMSHIDDSFSSYNSLLAPPAHRKRTRVALPEFGRWAATVWPELPAEFPRSPPHPSFTSSGWPWGAYETPLLKELAAAVQHFWTSYKPEAAPTKKQVIAWLKARGRTINEATAIAQIIRPPDLPGGPRRKKDGRKG